MARTYRNSPDYDKRDRVRQERIMRELRQWKSNLPVEKDGE
jgi:hypothetical protein